MKISVCLNYTTITIGLLLTLLNFVSIIYKAKFNHLKAMDENKIMNYHAGKCSSKEAVTLFTPEDPKAAQPVAKFTPDLADGPAIDCYLHKTTNELILKKTLLEKSNLSQEFSEFYTDIVEYYCRYGITGSIALYFTTLLLFILTSIRESADKNQYPKTISGKDNTAKARVDENNDDDNNGNKLKEI